MKISNKLPFSSCKIRYSPRSVINIAESSLHIAGLFTLKEIISMIDENGNTGV